MNICLLDTMQVLGQEILWGLGWWKRLEILCDCSINKGQIKILEIQILRQELFCFPLFFCFLICSKAIAEIRIITPKKIIPIDPFDIPALIATKTMSHIITAVPTLYRYMSSPPKKLSFLNQVKINMADK